MFELLKNLWRQEEGQDLVEYALIVAVVILVVVVMFRQVGGQLSEMFRTMPARLFKP